MGQNRGRQFVLSLEENAPEDVCPLASGFLLFLSLAPIREPGGDFMLRGKN